MCATLGISRSAYYYQAKEVTYDSDLENKVIQIFYENKKNYGTRRIKFCLKKSGYTASRRRIRMIMNKFGLISTYTIAYYKTQKSEPNNEVIDNIVNQDFDSHPKNQTIVSDLTYVRVGKKWHYICILIDLYNREIIGHSIGPNKDAQLVKEALLSANVCLSNVHYFHTDRGSEFKNKMIDEVLEMFDIKRSLSRKGNPYDNAVAEATFKTFKIEFVYQYRFEDIKALDIRLNDYINWYNNHRIHGSLNYLSPVEYRLSYSI